MGLWFLPQSRGIQDRWTGDCRECENECVWWTGHLCKGFSCLWPMKGSSLIMTLHRTRTRKIYGTDRKMDGCTVRVLVLLLSATLFFPTNVSSLIHVPKQNHSKAINLSKNNQKERKKERQKIWHLACLSAEIAFTCVWNIIKIS